MKKIMSIIMKVIILLYSFSSIALALVYRNQISPVLLISTIGVSLVLMIIVIVLLVNQEPDQTPKKQSTQDGKPTVYKETIEITETIVKPKEKPVVKKQVFKDEEEEYEELIPVKSRLGISKTESGDFVFGKKKILEETANIEKIPEVKKPIPKPVEPVKKNVRVDYSNKKINVDDIMSYPNPYGFEPELDEKHHENLVSLIEDMEEAGLIRVNPDFNNYDLLPKGIPYFYYNYKDIPHVTVVPQRDKSFKLLAGCSINKLYELAHYPKGSFKALDTLYPITQHMQGLISGGRYRMIDVDTDETIDKSIPHTVDIRIYHNH